VNGKYLFLDIETSGTEPGLHGIWQISGIIEINGKVLDKFKLHPALLASDVVDPGALEVCKKTEAEMRGGKDPKLVHKVLTQILAKHVDKYNRNDKYTMVAYNAQFDDTMLRAWFKKMGDSYYGSWIHFYKIDIFSVVALFLRAGKLGPIENLKLSTVTKHFGIDLDAHDSLNDIEASRQLFSVLASRIT
jgi:DNA polymerase III subunit epsilon